MNGAPPRKRSDRRSPFEWCSDLDCPNASEHPHAHTSKVYVPTEYDPDRPHQVKPEPTCTCPGTCFLHRRFVPRPLAPDD